jgi:hypothetical protein
MDIPCAFDFLLIKATASGDKSKCILCFLEGNGRQDSTHKYNYFALFGVSYEYWAFSPDDVKRFMLEANHGRKFSKPAANYVSRNFNLGYLKGWRIRKCRNCVFFQSSTSTCQVVEGVVDPEGSSRFFLPLKGVFPLDDLKANYWITKHIYPLGGLYLPF